MYSKTELQRVLETAFLPSKCECGLAPNDSLSVKLINPSSGEIDLYVASIPVSDLSTSRAIAQVVLSLKEQRDLMAQMTLSMRRLA